MRAKEFIIEVSLDSIGKKPIKGGMTLGQAVSNKLGQEMGQEIDEVQAIEMISAADPSPSNGMTRWLCMIFLSKGSNFKVPEDVAQVKSDLTTFAKLVKSKRIPEEQRDLGKIKSLNALYDIIEQFQGDDAEATSNKEAERQTKVEGADTIIQSGDLTIVHTKTQDANCLYGSNTKWCTTDKSSDYFNQYNSDGPLYVVIKGDRKFQFHYESDQFLDERDSEVSQEDIALLSSNPGWAKFLNMMIEKHYGKFFKDADAA